MHSSHMLPKKLNLILTYMHFGTLCTIMLKQYFEQQIMILCTNWWVRYISYFAVQESWNPNGPNPTSMAWRSWSDVHHLHPEGSWGPTQEISRSKPGIVSDRVLPLVCGRITSRAGPVLSDSLDHKEKTWKIYSLAILGFVFLTNYPEPTNN